MIDDWLGSFMMELSALLRHILLALTLLTLSETHQNATSFTSCLNRALSGKISPTDRRRFFSFSRLSRQKEILMIFTQGLGLHMNTGGVRERGVFSKGKILKYSHLCFSVKGRISRVCVANKAKQFLMFLSKK